jgi:GNAT superfamily N-acetyltransferase
VLLRRDDGYEISDDPARLDLDLVHHWLSTDAYWALGRPRDMVDRAVAGSLNFGLYRTDPSAGHAQVGFARLITDRATFAYLCDVYLDRSVRGRGLGTWFVGAICDEARGWGPRRILLTTADAHGLYAKLGFTAMTEPDRWMELRLAP